MDNEEVFCVHDYAADNTQATRKAVCADLMGETQEAAYLGVSAGWQPDLFVNTKNKSSFQLQSVSL